MVKGLVSYHDLILIALGCLTFLNGIISYLNHRAITTIHLEFNSRMTEFMKIASEADIAKGKLLGAAATEASMIASLHGQSTLPLPDASSKKELDA
jgi:hypothetical protein